MTIDSARVMRLGAEIGTIEPGKKANLLLLGADPLKNVKAYDAIETVFLTVAPSRGRRSRRAVRPRPGSDAPAPRRVVDPLVTLGHGAVVLERSLRTSRLLA